MNNEFDISMNDDLDWDAFRYVAHEMSDDEAVVFELRLANEQAAREAVAHAMELALSIVVCEREAASANMQTLDSSTNRHLRWRYVAGFVAASLVGCLIALSFWRANSSLPVVGVEVKSVESIDSNRSLADEKLMWSWIETRDTWSELDRVDDANADDAPDDVMIDDLEIEDSVNDVADDSVSAPNWMLVGLRGLNSSANSEVDSGDNLLPQGNLDSGGQLQ